MNTIGDVLDVRPMRGLSRCFSDLVIVIFWLAICFRLSRIGNINEKVKRIEVEKLKSESSKPSFQEDLNE